MSKHYYTDEKNALVVIALLKAFHIRNIIISPGATNDRFVLSVQGDDDFRLYSAVDERHAGYLAVGLTEETGCPVVINCTGATASRNYMPALTEAFYRKLPVLAITSSQHASHLGNLHPQMTDRFNLPGDIVNLSVQCPIPHTAEEMLDCQLKVNAALLALSRRGGGPVHINLETGYSPRYTVDKLPDVRRIHRVTPATKHWPEIARDAKVAVFIGSHQPFTDEQTSALEKFVQAHNAVVLTDRTSNYCGKCAVLSALLCMQKGMGANPRFRDLKPDLVIHVGEVSGDYSTASRLRGLSPVWRVSPDGELRDYFVRLENVFEMSEETFFLHYGEGKSSLEGGTFFTRWRDEVETLARMRPDIPFSNLWIATQIAPRLHDNDELHLGILNPLRCWNLVSSKNRRTFCNVGGFGIDGGTSSLIGASLVHPEQLYFGVFGDLSFFYDLNAIGSRHVGQNLRIVLINNGEGGEFSMRGNIYDNKYCGEKVSDFIAARGHFGNRSRSVVKHLAEDLGFRYLCASTKEEFSSVFDAFLDRRQAQSVIFECFTDVLDDRKSLEVYAELAPYSAPPTLKSLVSGILPGTIKEAIQVMMERGLFS
ncbi:MAG: thiamine pyrophosphate-binding protein [Kiritimatiellia bacterium]